MYLFRSDTYNDLNEIVRNSLYYSRLPHLPIECSELDGVPDTLPILVEEIYSPNDQPSTTILSSLNSKCKTENYLLHSKNFFIEEILYNYEKNFLR